MILINSSENLEDHKESQERIGDKSGESSNTLLMKKLRFIKEKCVRSPASYMGELGLTSGSHVLSATPQRTLRPRTVPFNEGCGMLGVAN